MRTMYGVDRLEHTHYLFYDSHSLKFPDIVRLKTVLFMFIAYNNNLPTNLQNLFVKRTPLHSARRTHQFLREHVRTNIRAMSLPVLGVKLWNSLSTSLMPPSHRRRGATTVFGKNRHHRSDTASSFS